MATRRRGAGCGHCERQGDRLRYEVGEAGRRVRRKGFGARGSREEESGAEAQEARQAQIRASPLAIHGEKSSSKARNRPRSKLFDSGKLKKGFAK